MTYETVVVSAADGPLLQTIEQLKALKAQGATTVNIVISHTDLVDGCGEGSSRPDCGHEGAA
jgi:translation elongation factor EF-Tu-like GTPase